MPSVNTLKHGFLDEPICDSHVHLAFQMPLPSTARMLRGYARYFGCSRIALLGLPHSSRAANTDPSNQWKALCLKALLNAEDGVRVHAFGGLYHHYDGRDTAAGFLAQVGEMAAAGFDGVKLLLGKPDQRKRLGRPLDDPIYDPFYDFCEENAFPVTMHLGDPGDWWLPRGGRPPVYGADFPTLPQLRSEVEGILEKHPALDLVLCHFYFTGDDPEFAARFFERHPTAKFDLTPGCEMYAGFSRRADEWRDFFRRYRTRLFFGSDSDNWASPETDEGFEHNFAHIFNLVRRALESPVPYRFEDEDLGLLEPLRVDDETRRSIYSGNFIRRLGEPRPVDRALALAAVKRLIPLYEAGEVPCSPERAAVDLENCRIMEQYFDGSGKII